MGCGSLEKTAFARNLTLERLLLSLILCLKSKHLTFATLVLVELDSRILEVILAFIITTVVVPGLRLFTLQIDL